MSGSAYHDHNWGNIGLTKLFNHWYWARAEIGPYKVVASEMIATKKYNNNSIVVLNISKDCKTVADDGSKVKMMKSFGKMNPKIKKDVSDNIVFTYGSPKDKEKYEVSFIRDKNIVELDIVSYMLKSKFLAFPAKKITGLEPAYFRMVGKAKIKVYKEDKLMKTFTSPQAVWELMYLGKPFE